MEGSFDVSEDFRVAGNAYFRAIDTDTFNGDGTIFEECEFDDDEFLVEEDFEDLNGDGECAADLDDGDHDWCSTRTAIPSRLSSMARSSTPSTTSGAAGRRVFGASLQLAFGSDLGPAAAMTSRWGWHSATARRSFDSVVEVASLLENRATSRTGIFADEFRTQVDSDLTTWSVYFVDTLRCDRAVEPHGVGPLRRHAR